MLALARRLLKSFPPPQSMLPVYLLLGLSFLPSRIKVFLHTRGPLHPWAHVYVFAAVTVDLLAKVGDLRSRCVRAVALVALGFLIEFAQARANPAAIELEDVMVDLAGVAFGSVLAAYRTSDRSALLPLQGSLLD